MPRLADVYLGEARALTRLALPLAAALAGNQLMGLVDAAMVGRLGSEPLAGVGTGSWIFLALTYVGVGCVLGIDPIISQMLGANEPERARHTLWQGIYVGALVSLPLMLGLWLIPSGLRHFDVDPGTLYHLEQYLLGRLPGIAPFLWFIALRSYLQTSGITRPVVVAMLLANVANLVSNGLLIFGDEALVYFGLVPLGLPPLGALGAGLASSCAVVASLLVLASSFAAHGRRAPLDSAIRRFDVALFRKILRFGLPLGLQQLARLAAVAIIAVMAGRISAAAAAAFHIIAMLGSLSVTIANGLASAATVRIGRHIGARKPGEARRAGTAALFVVGLCMAVWAFVFIAFPQPLTHLFTGDPLVHRVAVPLFIIAAALQLSDGGQRVSTGMLVGAGDTNIIFYITLVGHYMIGIPTAYILAFEAQIGVVGLVWGITFAYTFVALCLTVRFYSLALRPIIRTAASEG
ncbi:MAG: MATE family efflux transporter [Proteobacteria bacterium]|nr:MATE family efflux transporter [Pseudomonadota bacterium]